MGIILSWFWSEETENVEHNYKLQSDSPRYHVAFLGDSTLDNVAWVRHNEEIAALVRSRGIEVSNLAVDGATSSDILQTASTLISMSARRAAKDPFPDDGDSESHHTFSSLKALEIRQRKKKIDAVVLSVGGNDIRVLLGQLGGGGDQSIVQMALTALVKNYIEIVSRVMKICPNSHLILMTQYMPDYQNDSYHIYRIFKKEQLFEMMKNVYNSIIPHLRKYKATVIDLTASFDPRETSLYVQQIEPSKKGGIIIADLVEHAVQMGESEDLRFLLRTSEGKIMEATRVQMWTACPPAVREIKGYCGILRKLNEP